MVDHVYCVVCGAQFCTEKDLFYHYEAHDEHGANLPCMTVLKTTPFYSEQKWKERIKKRVDKTLGRYHGNYAYDGFWETRPIIINRDNNQCKKCGSKENIRVHHINGDKRDQSFNNLITLCAKCHSGEHK